MFYFFFFAGIRSRYWSSNFSEMELEMSMDLFISAEDTPGSCAGACDDMRREEHHQFGFPLGLGTGFEKLAEQRDVAQERHLGIRRGLGCWR